MERATSSSALIEEAKAHPDGWVYDTDWQYADNQHVPTEAIRGAWRVDAQGQLTDEFNANPHYRPIEECDRALKPYMAAGALHNPNQWISEIAPEAEHLFPAIPDTAIVGWWYVNEEGVITRMFRPNSKYEPTLKP